ncbi:hypothetical protein [Flexivirga sp. B27]
MPPPKRPMGRPKTYTAPPEPDFAEAVEAGHESTLLACRGVLSRRLDAGVPAREVAALVSVASLVEKELHKLQEGRR